MPSVFIDSDLRVMYEVPSVPHTFEVLPNGLRRYTPDDNILDIEEYDALRDVYSPWVVHRAVDDADYAPIAFDRSGGAEINETTNSSTDLFFRNDLGWKFAAADYPHEWLIKGNIRRRTKSVPLFETRHLTTSESFVSIELASNLLINNINSGSSVSDADIENIATSVWSADISDHQAPNSFGQALVLSKKILQNRKTTDPVTGFMTVFDDDSVTPLLTANIHEDALRQILYNQNSTTINNQDRLA